MNGKLLLSLGRIRRSAGFFLLLAVFVALAPGNQGCGEDNPANPGTGEVCDHFDADGVVVEDGGETAVSQWEGFVVGTLEVGPGGSRSLSVVFLDPDSIRGIPVDACTDQLLDVVVADENIATVALDAPNGRWSFTLSGVAEGETTIRVYILHADHPDFTSLELPVVVGDEVAIEGFRILDGSHVLVEQVEGTLTGGLELKPAGSLGPLDVVFLDADGDAVTPEEGAVLDFLIDDAGIASISQAGLGPYAFQVQSAAEGETSFTFSLLHMGHSDFDSQPVPVAVEAIPSPEAALVREGPNPLSFWNYDPVRGPGRVQGGILVQLSTMRTSLTVGWLGTYDSGLVNDKRPELVLPDGQYDMTWSVADGGIAEVVAGSLGPFAFDVKGLTEGTTSVRFHFRHNGEVVFTTGSFPIEVVPDPASMPVPDHYLNLGGAWTVIVVDGEVVSNGCSRDASPGSVSLDAGELSALYKITLLDEQCAKTQLDSSYEYRFHLSTPGVARILQDPIHWAEIQVFHVEGLSPGTTELSVSLLRNGQFQWMSPPYQVVVQ